MPMGCIASLASPILTLPHRLTKCSIPPRPHARSGCAAGSESVSCALLGTQSQNQNVACFDFMSTYYGILLHVLVRWYRRHGTTYFLQLPCWKKCCSPRFGLLPRFLLRTCRSSSCPWLAHSLECLASARPERWVPLTSLWTRQSSSQCYWRRSCMVRAVNRESLAEVLIIRG